MSKRLLGLILGSLITLGLLGYWFSTRPQGDEPAIANLPPAQAIGFLAVPGLPQAWHDLQRSKFFRQVTTPAYWQRALGENGYQRLLEAKHQAERRLGVPITEQTVGHLLGREVGLALVPSQGGLWPVDVIAYIRVSGSERIAETFVRGFSSTMQDLVRDARTVDGTELVTLRSQDGTALVSYAFLDSLAVLSTDSAWVIDAINARHGTATDRLDVSTPLQISPPDGAQPLLAYGSYQVTSRYTDTLSQQPWAAHPWLAASLSMLPRTTRISMQSHRTSDGVKVETLAQYPANGTSRVWREAKRDGAVPPFAGVPAETFYLTHIDLLHLQGLWALLKQFLTLTSPQLLEHTLTQFRVWTGVDLEREVIPLFSGIGGLGITAPFGPERGGPFALPGIFLTLGVTDEARGQQLIQRIGTHAGGPMFSEFLRRLPHNGQTISYLNHPFFFIKPGYVTSHQQLILASDVGLLQHMLDVAAGRAPPLSKSTAYRTLRRHFQAAGGSTAFIDVTTAAENARDASLRLGFLLPLLTHAVPGLPSLGAVESDPSALLELVRPIRYIGAASEAGPQGVKTEAFIAFEDLR